MAASCSAASRGDSMAAVRCWRVWRWCLLTEPGSSPIEIVPPITRFRREDRAILQRVAKAVSVR
jgi:hypothetical protein